MSVTKTVSERQELRVLPPEGHHRDDQRKAKERAKENKNKGKGNGNEEDKKEKKQWLMQGLSFLQ